jgi:hypothetical protein
LLIHHRISAVSKGLWDRGSSAIRLNYSSSKEGLAQNSLPQSLTAQSKKLPTFLYQKQLHRFHPFCRIHPFC